MSPTLSALEEVVTRHGRAALDDPLTLTGALRSLTDPPPEEDVVALAEAARGGAARRIRAALEDGGSPEEALRTAAGPGATDAHRRATARIGAALGLLPRSMAGDAPDSGEATTAVVPPPARPRRRTRALLIAAVVVLLLLAVAGGLLLDRDTPGSAASTPEAAAEPAPGAGPDTATPAPDAAPADPRAAFTDPVLRATAEPYLRIPGTTCRKSEESVDTVLREQVVCTLGGDVGGGIFARYFDPVTVTRLREFMGADETVVPGSRRELRWEYVPGRDGVRAGIPVGSGRDGVGTRIRWLGLDPKVPLLYFDEESTGTVVQLSLLDGGDQEQLRRLWADPAGLTS